MNKSVKQRKMEKKVAVLLLMMLSFHCHAQYKWDHLEPVGEPPLALFSFARQDLLSGLSNYPEVRYVIIPSLRMEEEVVDIRYDKEEENYQITYRIFGIYKAAFPSKEETCTKVREYVKSIDTQSVEQLKGLFTLFIDRARPYEESRRLLDGEDYYFFVNGEERKGGRAFTPYKDTKLEELVAITTRLIKEVRSKKTTPVTLGPKLTARIENLRNRVLSEAGK